MIPRSVIAGVFFSFAAAAHAVDGAPQDDRFIRLACSGVMVAGGGSTESSIVANGSVDLANKRVGGFGIGVVPILHISTTEVRFGTSALEAGDGPQRIEGSFNPITGETRIVVRSQRRPSEIAIRMVLACRTKRSVS